MDISMFIVPDGFVMREHNELFSKVEGSFPFRLGVVTRVDDVKPKIASTQIALVPFTEEELDLAARVVAATKPLDGVGAVVASPGATPSYMFQVHVQKLMLPIFDPDQLVTQALGTRADVQRDEAKADVKAIATQGSSLGASWRAHGDAALDPDDEDDFFGLGDDDDGNLSL